MSHTNNPWMQVDDEKFLDAIERKLYITMFEGCSTDIHLGNTPQSEGWSVCFRSDTVSRLLDLAKKGAASE